MESIYTVRVWRTIKTLEPSAYLETRVQANSPEHTESEIPTEPWQWWGAAFAVDHRPAGELIEGLLCEGFTVALC